MTRGLWEFSVDVYSRPGVEDACQKLQDQYGVDVNFLLFCIWCGKSGTRLIADDFHTLIEFSDDWAINVVKPLREARKWMKHMGCSMHWIARTDYQKTRDQIKAVELDSEKLQQHALGSLLEARKTANEWSESQLEDTMVNLRQYLNYLEIRLNPEIMTILDLILMGALDEYKPGEIHSI